MTKAGLTSTKCSIPTAISGKAVIITPTIIAHPPSATVTYTCDPMTAASLNAGKDTLRCPQMTNNALPPGVYNLHWNHTAINVKQFLIIKPTTNTVWVSKSMTSNIIGSATTTVTSTQTSVIATTLPQSVTRIVTGTSTCTVTVTVSALAERAVSIPTNFVELKTLATVPVHSKEMESLNSDGLVTAQEPIPTSAFDREGCKSQNGVAGDCER